MGRPSRFDPRPRPPGEPIDWAAISAECRRRFPKVLAYLHASEKNDEALLREGDDD